jgi:hypothetical protein
MPHESFEVLGQRLHEASQLVPLDSYRHYKGSIYHVVGYTVLKQNDEAGIRYFDIKHPSITFTTPISDWLGPLIIDGQEVERYKRID